MQQIDHYKQFLKSKLTKSEYLRQYNLPKHYFSTIHINCNRLLRHGFLSKKEFSSMNIKPIVKKNKISIEEDKQGNVTTYNAEVNEKVFTFSPEEMNELYALYSSSGGNLTKKEIVQKFPYLTEKDCGVLFKLLKITRGVLPIAPHVLIQEGVEEIIDSILKGKENLIREKLNSSLVRYYEQKNKELLAENIRLGNLNNGIEKVISSFFSAPPHKEPIDSKLTSINVTQTLNLYLADLHIGAAVSKNSLYPNQYNMEVVKDRLAKIIQHIKENYLPDTCINIILLGDMLDGMNNETARGGHFLPQNLDNYEQVREFLSVMEWFILKLQESFPTIQVFSVNTGNHGGTVEYVTIKALFTKLYYQYKISCTQSEHFFYPIQIGKYTFIITHGYDDKFMKTGFPLNLNDNTKNRIEEWLNHYNYQGRDIHIIKGDLHQENINNTYRFSYRNVVSLFGSSDYSMMNFTKSITGVSFDFIRNNILYRGVIEV